MTRLVSRTGFRAMSTDVELAGVGVAQAVVETAARRGLELAEVWEQTFSRFRAGSELCRLNAAAGRPVRVSETFLSLLDLAVAAAKQTGGRFNPAVLPALEAAGYDRDIAEVRTSREVTGFAHVSECGDVARIEIDRERQTVRLPNKMRLDLGGIAKGAFVDLLAAEVADWPGGSVDAGGDLRCWGIPPSGASWVVGIEDPRDPGMDRLVAEVRRSDAGVATSGTYQRRWGTGAAVYHHLIDPLTRLPLSGRTQAATAVAATTVEAEVATKSLMIAASRGEPLIPLSVWVAVVMRDDGGVEFVAGTDRDACTFSTIDLPCRSA
jgi:thiamine biosynthesis lipoprotein